MPRLLFEKTGNAVWISHLDLMRLFQRAFKRAGLPLTHTQGYNPRPSVSIALPLSVGVSSKCELLDFDLDGDRVDCNAIRDRLNETLVEGVKVLSVYEDGRAMKHLALLDSVVTLEYDSGIPHNAVEELMALFNREELKVEKKSKSGITQQDIVPMIRHIHVFCEDDHTVHIQLRGCCQNPTLNPMQIHVAVCKYLPHLQPDFVHCRREEIYDAQETVFR